MYCKWFWSTRPIHLTTLQTWPRSSWTTHGTFITEEECVGEYIIRGRNQLPSRTWKRRFSMSTVSFVPIELSLFLRFTSFRDFSLNKLINKIIFFVQISYLNFLPLNEWVSLLFCPSTWQSIVAVPISIISNIIIIKSRLPKILDKLCECTFSQFHSYPPSTSSFVLSSLLETFQYPPTATYIPEPPPPTHLINHSFAEYIYTSVGLREIGNSVRFCIWEGRKQFISDRIDKFKYKQNVILIRKLSWFIAPDSADKFALLPSTIHSCARPARERHPEHKVWHHFPMGYPVLGSHGALDTRFWGRHPCWACLGGRNL